MSLRPFQTGGDKPLDQAGEDIAFKGGGVLGPVKIPQSPTPAGQPPGIGAEGAAEHRVVGARKLGRAVLSGKIRGQGRGPVQPGLDAHRAPVRRGQNIRDRIGTLYLAQIQRDAEGRLEILDRVFCGLSKQTLETHGRPDTCKMEAEG